jgi:hypothetical protein
VLILGNSIFEGVGTALLIPPVYILTTLLFHDIKSRGVRAISGDRIGALRAVDRRLITTGISWRAASSQAPYHRIILLLGRVSTWCPRPTRPFDIKPPCPPRAWWSWSGDSGRRPGLVLMLV